MYIEKKCEEKRIEVYGYKHLFETLSSYPVCVLMVDSYFFSCFMWPHTWSLPLLHTDEVEDLIALSLHEPVRLFIDRNTQVLYWS